MLQWSIYSFFNRKVEFVTYNKINNAHEAWCWPIGNFLSMNSNQVPLKVLRVSTLRHMNDGWEAIVIYIKIIFENVWDIGGMYTIPLFMIFYNLPLIKIKIDALQYMMYLVFIYSNDVWYYSTFKMIQTIPMIDLVVKCKVSVLIE